MVGGLSLFETPEIRDLEQAMRAVANPQDDVALVRMMTAGPWRLDALEIAAVSTGGEVRRPPAGRAGGADGRPTRPSTPGCAPSCGCSSAASTSSTR